MPSYILPIYRNERVSDQFGGRMIATSNSDERREERGRETADCNSKPSSLIWPAKKSYQVLMAPENAQNTALPLQNGMERKE